MDIKEFVRDELIPYVESCEETGPHYLCNILTVYCTPGMPYTDYVVRIDRRIQESLKALGISSFDNVFKEEKGWNCSYWSRHKYVIQWLEENINDF